MSDRWPLVPLSEVLTQRKEFVQIDDEQEYKRCRVQLHAQGIVLRDIVPGAAIKTKRQQVCHAGEFLVAEIDAKVGGFGLVPASLEGAIVSSHYFLFCINTARVEPRFLAFYVRTGDFREQVSAQGTTNYAAVRPGDVLTYQMPLPPLHEQRRIVVRIEELAGKIEEARGLRREAQEQRESFIVSLHLSASGDRSVGLSEAVALDEQRVQVEAGAEYPQAGVKSFGRGLFPRETLLASQTTYKYFNRLYSGALVLSQVKGWEGAVAVCPPHLADRYVSPEYRTFRCLPDKMLPEYAAALVPTSWFWDQLKDVTRGVGARRERIRPEHFVQLTIPLPDVESQAKLLSVFDGIDALTPLQVDTAAALDALLPSVLDKAFKGEL